MFVLFFILWLLMAGAVTVRVCLWGAAVSALLWGLCRRTLGYRPGGWKELLHKSWPTAAFLGVLLAEMLKAGFVVMKLIYTKGKDMEPRLIWFDTTLKSDAARAALANAITLTAGTITVEAEGERLCVHALDASLAEGIENCGFQRRLEKLEG